MSKTFNDDYFKNIDKNEKIQERVDALENWRNGSLVNNETLQKLTLKQLTEVAKILEGIK
jgi:hypothetical protein|tara:strand:- start:164 stop:343 length:180 start_codon:yes stop_codon:yes gene_type:complete